MGCDVTRQAMPLPHAAPCAQVNDVQWCPANSTVFGSVTSGGRLEVGGTEGLGSGVRVKGVLNQVEWTSQAACSPFSSLLAPRFSALPRLELLGTC